VKGHDVIVQVPSGIGSALTYVISILQRLDMSVKAMQAIILVPSRELAQKILQVVLSLGNYMNVKCYACVGGTNGREDMAKLNLQQGLHIVIGTPDRVLEMINVRAIRTENIKILCHDDADQMWSRGFKDHIYQVFQALPHYTQVVLLSATMPDNVLEVTKKFMRDPVRIVVKGDESIFESQVSSRKRLTF
jgi:translation initiation factor 4A